MLGIFTQAYRLDNRMGWKSFFARRADCYDSFLLWCGTRLYIASIFTKNSNLRDFGPLDEVAESLFLSVQPEYLAIHKRYAFLTRSSDRIWFIKEHWRINCFAFF